MNSRPGPGILPNLSNISFSDAPVSAVFFYGDGCSHCENVKPFLAEIQARYPGLHLQMLEIYNNATNREKFSVMNRQYGTVNAGIPEIFIGNRTLIGDEDIKTHFEESIIAEQQRRSSSNTIATSQNISIPAAPATLTSSAQLTPQLVMVSALIDSLNPCAFSVLVFLLITISVAGNRRRILMVGATYVLALFSFHLLAGVGLFSVVILSGFSKVFSLLGASLAVLFGVITLIEVVRNKESYLLAIPESKKQVLGHYIQTATLPAAFVLGILAGVFGFSCTGGIYISILSLMSRGFTLMSGLPYLILYNLIFILPLVLVVLLIAFGIPPERANTWRIDNRRVLRLIVGLTMIALGAIIFSGWLG